MNVLYTVRVHCTRVHHSGKVVRALFSLPSSCLISVTSLIFISFTGYLFIRRVLFTSTKLHLQDHGISGTENRDSWCSLHNYSLGRYLQYSVRIYNLKLLYFSRGPLLDLRLYHYTEFIHQVYLTLLWIIILRNYITTPVCTNYDTSF